MMFPPSLPEDVKARAFRAHNGELGLLLTDTAAFLAACRADRVGVLGWEAWIVDHQWSLDTNWPAPAPGSWSGGVPVTDQDVPAVIAYSGDADQTERQIASIDFNKEVRSAWLAHIRINFTIAD